MCLSEWVCGKTCEEKFFMRYDISNKQVIDGWFVKNNSSQIALIQLNKDMLMAIEQSLL